LRPLLPASPRLSRPLAARLLAGVAVLLLAVPAAAQADTITVDDDKAQCPAATYSSLVSAVAAAEQFDTIKICDGTYPVPGGATSPGLRIDKNLTLRGAGADKVFVQPDLAGASMAAASPNPRDEYGNVITVSKRRVELFDVSISGLTVRSYRGEDGEGVEGGIALINVNDARISHVRVTDLVPATGPGTGLYGAALATSGYGIIAANHVEATTNVVSITDSTISGYNRSGVLLDGRLLNGANPTATNAGSLRATIAGTRIAGAGGSPAIAQNGIETVGGPCLRVTGSEIVDNGSPAPSADAAGILLRGADTSPGCGLIWPSSVTGSTIAGNAYGIANGNLNGTQSSTTFAASGNWWGDPAGASAGLPRTTGDPVGANVDASGPLAAAIASPAVPGPVADAPPTIAFDLLADGAAAHAGTPLAIDAVPADDFGVKSVAYTVDGVPITAFTAPDLSLRSPYAASWTPTTGDKFTSHTVVATATDSSGQTASVTAQVLVDPDTTPPVTTDDVPTGWTAGPATVTLSASDGDGMGVTATYYVVGTNPDNPTTASAVYDPASKPVLAAGERIRYFSVDAAGLVEAVKTSAALQVDAVAPVTAATPAAGLVATPAVLTLTATDDASGVALTEYRLGDGAWTAYTAPVPLSAGPHAIQYRSTDVAGNAEPAKSLAVDVRDPAAAPGAADVTAVSATLKGLLGPGVAHYEFLYRRNGVTDWTVSGKTPVPGTDPVSLALDGLTPQTIYYYKVRAYLPGGGYAYSPIVSFTTTPQGLSPADVTVDPVTDLTTTGATLGATVNLHGSSGIGVLEWGTSAGTYTKSAAMYYTATSTGRDFYRALPTQFLPGTIYHYKITVTNATGSITTGDQTFTTLSPPVPVVTIGAVSPIGPNTATINTVVDTDGAAITGTSVQWGTTPAYGKSLPLLSGAAQPDGSRIYTRPLISMKPNTVYHYKVTVTTAFGTYESTDRTFTTTP